MRCAIVVPEATRHPKDVLEIVAPVSVKEHYGLKDGDEIEVEIE
jgi:riboflavin kinase